jgi:ribonuclease HI
MKVYTDGSDIQSRVGAAAWEPHRQWKCMADIGPSDQFTVYGAELIGIWMALDMGVKGGNIVKKLTIFTDNQASIVSSARPRNQSGQLILKKIHWLASILRKRGCAVTIRWIPAHIGVPGNEVADTLVKQATGWRSKKDTGPLVDARTVMKMAWLPQLLSSCKRQINSFAREAWTWNWRNGVTGMLYKKRWHGENGDGNGIVLDRHVNKLYNPLSHKAEASVLIQMRTEKIGLHGYLNKIKRADDPWCGCEQAYQTVRHIIEDCECLEDTRFTYLGASYVRDARIFLRDAKLIPKTVRFMLSTGLLDQFASFAKTLSPL